MHGRWLVQAPDEVRKLVRVRCDVQRPDVVHGGVGVPDDGLPRRQWLLVASDGLRALQLSRRDVPACVREMHAHRGRHLE